MKVCVSREKLNVLSCLEDKKLEKMLTLSPDETNLHVISMGMLNIKDLGTYLEKFTKYENLIGTMFVFFKDFKEQKIVVDKILKNSI